MYHPLNVYPVRDDEGRDIDDPAGIVCAEEPDPPFPLNETVYVAKFALTVLKNFLSSLYKYCLFQLLEEF